ncbi:DUF4097 family beta strand repeat-containing protein [Thermococcus pacificus]|uniref:Adhesin domain-containing protein n=1 Tax=Thermococcus pacificus TaxID=71998 RepID=A0A218P582_9EURY|nr:hypothetical protein [Thermococcus pacificus]ASJ05939.1 hypothetical protein A3L08_00600 [Thermococcus pacificus]
MLRRGGVLPIIAGVVLAVILIGAVAAAVIVHKYQTHRKEAGPLKELGAFDAGGVVIRDTVGDVRIVRANVSGVVLKSNLPVKANYSGGLLTVYCPTERKRGLLRFGEHNACSDYRDGKVVIEVGRKLADIWVKDTVGDVEVDVNATRLVLKDVVGDVRASAPAEYLVEDIVGDVSIDAEGDVEVSDVVGDVYISIPANFSVQLSVKDVVGDVENTHSGEGMPVLVRVSDVVGDVRIGQ